MQQQLTLDPDTFSASYMSIVSHLSHQDPVLAEYFLAHFPHSLQMDLKVFTQVKNNTNRWLKTAVYGTPLRMSQTIVPWDTFANAVHSLATVSTYGSTHFPRNRSRANKFILVLKRMGDERYKDLQTANNQQKRKSLQQ